MIFLRLVGAPVLLQRISTQLGLLAVLLVPLASCSGLAGKSLQDTFAADPRLNSSPSPLDATNSQPTPAPQVQLPPQFPAEVPTYPNATLVAATSADELPLEPGAEVLTRWTTGDSRDRVIAFYRDQLQKNGWKLNQQPTQNQGNFEASRNGLQIAIEVQPNDQAGTRITIETKTSNAQAAQSPTSSSPQPGDPEFVGPIPPGNPASSTSSASPDTAQTQEFADLNKAPQQLRSYITDLAQLGVLTPSNSKEKNSAKMFEPNKTITRGEYARWLVATNNRVYANRPARQVRLGVETAPPAFQDVSAKNSNFAAIQGLAEAGLIPSSLSGDSTAVLFRPNAPLSREDLILWKIPVDLRQSLPTATLEAVKQTWGFQDAGRIDSRALRAVLADYQNGDQANIRRAFGYTTLFQPKRPVTRAEAAAVLWYFGFQGDGVSAQDVLRGNSKA